MCLVLAYELIRKAAASAGLQLGPILMLSYKNHALDEFLADIVKFSPSNINSGMLIRAGKPENEILMKFAERTSPLELSTQAILNERILILRSTDYVARNWLDCANYLECLFQVRILQFMSNNQIKEINIFSYL